MNSLAEAAGILSRPLKSTLVETLAACFNLKIADCLREVLGAPEAPPPAPLQASLFSRGHRSHTPDSPKTEPADSQSRSFKTTDHRQARYERKRREALRARNFKSTIKPAMKKYNKIAKMRRRDTQVLVGLNHDSFRTSVVYECQPFAEKPSMQTLETAPERAEGLSEAEHSVLGEDNLLLLIKEGGDAGRA